MMNGETVMTISVLLGILNFDQAGADVGMLDLTPEV